MARISAIIPAAGLGKRMGTSVSKSYMEILGRPLLTYTLERFQSHSLIDEIILVAQEKDLDYCKKEIVEKYGFNKVTKIVPGGKERQDSVAQGLAALEPEVEWVVVHDGARPLVDGQTISEVIRVAFGKGAAIAGVPLKDTIKVVDGEMAVQDTPRRHTIWAIQTPQVFRRDILENAYREAARQGWIGTDDASLVEYAGGKVYVVRGRYSNIKVTTPEDLPYIIESLKRGE